MSRVPIDEILELPAVERMEIMHQIWDSLVAEHPYPSQVSAAHREELDRRLQELQKNPDEGEDWEDVKKSLLEE